MAKSGKKYKEATIARKQKRTRKHMFSMTSAPPQLAGKKEQRKAS
jgi:hypothetical protein